MSIKPIPELEKLKPGLIVIARERLQSSKNILEKIILSTALIKWKEEVDLLHVSAEDLRSIEKNNLPFFIGNIPSYFKQPWKEDCMGLGFLLYYHYCPAWNDCLLLEYMLLNKN